MIKRIGDAWILFSRKGKILGEHASELAAKAQEMAIQVRTRGKNVGGSGNRGQFVRTDMSRMCVCGKTLGDHTAARPHECDDTGCEKFRPARKKP